MNQMNKEHGQKEMRPLTKEFTFSEKSKTFLENLRIYLFSTGKKADEIEEIVNELEIHLHEAEKNGKPIEKIIGTTPKEYMEMISNEMVIDYRTWFKYICLIIFASFSIKIFPDLLEGTLSYSVLEVVGHIVIVVIFIASIFTCFKYISTTDPSIKKLGIILISISILPIALFVGLIYLNRTIATPIIHFSLTGSLIIGVVAALILIGTSFWAKTWVIMIVVALLTLPNYFLDLTSLKYETQRIIGWLITCVGMIIYIWVSSKLTKSK